MDNIMPYQKKFLNNYFKDIEKFNRIVNYFFENLENDVKNIFSLKIKNKVTYDFSSETNLVNIYINKYNLISINLKDNYIEINENFVSLFNEEYQENIDDLIAVKKDLENKIKNLQEKSKKFYITKKTLKQNMELINEWNETLEYFNKKINQLNKEHDIITNNLIEFIRKMINNYQSIFISYDYVVFLNNRTYFKEELDKKLKEILKKELFKVI